jgi:acyl-CoA thioester hydrolase
LSEGYRFCHSLRVRYAEIDGQMIVFNSHYLTYLDIGITEYFRNLGMAMIPSEEPIFDFALVKTTLEFKGSGLFDDVLNVYVKVSKLGNSSFVTNFMIRKEGGTEPIVLAESIYAGYDMRIKRSVPIPDEVRRLIENFEATAPVLA